jgi:radical SAM family uncharacterized protein/radical SAM-linked protein
MRFSPLAVDDLILSVQKPSRYAGGEFNSIVKSLPDAGVTWALCFPDAYEVGMSNVGFRVLYHALNERPDVAAERAFMPWHDMSAAMKQKGVPLFALESRAPVRDFDVLGFSLQFELCYPTVLAMLDLARVPLWAKDRTEKDPLVIAGGPGAYSPEPVAPFVDAFVIGEGEEVVHEISDAVQDWKASGGKRQELLWRLSEIPGVYVPAYFAFTYSAEGPISEIVPLKPGYEQVTRRIIPDLNLVPQALKPILPYMQTVHDRLPMEIQRGCTRSCRFCQVGMITRPTRQRDPAQVLKLAEAGLANTGYEQVGFLSLSAGDYQALNPMLEDFFERFEADQIAVGLPSLRTETMNDRLAAQVKRVRKTGFTMAPEAASERMRRVINKGNHEADLLKSAGSVFKAGWDNLKLYFMIGLPTERDEDVVAIAELTKKVLRIGQQVAGGAGPEINLGVSTFVPKPFTPFQWEPMLSLAEAERRQRLIKSVLGKSKGIDFRYHDAKMAHVEGTLTRGDRRVATAVYEAFKLGQTFAGWSEHFSYRAWEEAFKKCEAEHGVGLAFFSARERGEQEVLPWDHLDCEVTKPFLLKERAASRKEAEVIDCALDPCSACGACDYDVVTTRVYREADYVKAAPVPERPAPTLVRTALRVRFGKSGRAVALSHLEVGTALMRALRRSKLPLAFSLGFHPKPKISFGPACPVGVASEAEYVDLELQGAVTAEQVVAALGPQMPPGTRLLGCELLKRGARGLSESIEEQTFRVRFPAEVAEEALSARVAWFTGESKVEVVRDRLASRVVGGPDRAGVKASSRTFDLKQYVTGLAASPGREVVFTVRAGNDGSVRPSEVLQALWGAGALPEGISLLKERVSFARA